MLPQLSPVVGLVTCTFAEPPLANVPTLPVSTPLTMDQAPLGVLPLAMAHWSPPLVGSVSVTDTPVAVPDPVLVVHPRGELIWSNLAAAHWTFPHDAKAQAIFAKVRAVMDQKRDIRAEITRDGLVDYYAGLGKALSGGDKVDEGAREAFRACAQYLPSSVSVLPERS